MSLLKKITKLGKSAMNGLGMNGNKNFRTQMKAGNDRNMHDKAVHTLSLNVVHVRNGTRGDGIGMGHQINKPNQSK